MTDGSIWRYLLIGAVGGFLSGFAGIGGGVVLIPLMVGLLALSQHQAHGTSLAIIIPTAVVALVPYYVTPAHGEVPMLDLALAYAITAVIGAPIGARLITLVNPRALRKLFGLLLLSLSIGSLTRRTPYEELGNVALAIGLLALIAGAVLVATRQRRLDAQRAIEAGR